MTNTTNAQRDLDFQARAAFREMRRGSVSGVLAGEIALEELYVVAYKDAYIQSMRDTLTIIVEQGARITYQERGTNSERGAVSKAANLAFMKLLELLGLVEGGEILDFEAYDREWLIYTRMWYPNKGTVQSQ